MKEIWKNIPDYEGFYQVSNIGRVKSLKRKVKHRHGGLSVIKERILKGIDRGGYLGVDLCKECNSKTFNIHRLVLIAFIGYDKNPFYKEVDHRDRCKTNNNLDNLRWSTCSANVRNNGKIYTSKYTGVSWDNNSKKWKSVVSIKNKRIHLGIFETEKEAAQAYNRALIRYMLRDRALNQIEVDI